MGQFSKTSFIFAPYSFFWIFFFFFNFGVYFFSFLYVRNVFAIRIPIFRGVSFIKLFVFCSLYQFLGFKGMLFSLIFEFWQFGIFFWNQNIHNWRETASILTMGIFYLHILLNFAPPSLPYPTVQCPNRSNLFFTEGIPNVMKIEYTPILCQLLHVN